MNKKNYIYIDRYINERNRKNKFKRVVSAQSNCMRSWFNLVSFIILKAECKCKDGAVLNEEKLKTIRETESLYTSCIQKLYLFK